MSISSVKRLHNEMINFESENIKKIPPNKYYIIYIYITTTISNSINSQDYKEFIESQLSSIDKPISVYYSINKILLIYSAIDEQESHQLNGDIELIISKYVFNFAKNMDKISNISAKIIQFSTQIEIFAYLSWIIDQTKQETMLRISSGMITSKELHFRTDNELINILKTQGVLWEPYDEFEKYGILMKLVRKKNNMIIIKMSEPFDSRENKKYLKFIFG